MLLFLFILLLLNKINGDYECPTILSSEDRRTNKNILRLVQYNVEWLFIDHYSAFDCPGSQCTWKNVSEAQTHLSYVSKVVNELQPDIINFCEVEGCDELSLVIDNLGIDYKGYLKKGTDTGTGQNVGMITKIDPLLNLYRTEEKYNYPIKDSSCGYTGTQSSTGVSKHYITEYKLGDYNIAFISAHLIAIPTDPARCAQREAQAQILQNVIHNYIQKGYEIIMMGDMNDFDAEVLDLNNNRPLSRTLDILKGLYGDYKNTYELFSVAESITKNERYSDWWDSDNNCNTSSQNDYSMIDHILVTDAIKKNIINVFIYHGYAEFCGKYNSDHFPVVVDLLL